VCNYHISAYSAYNDSVLKIFICIREAESSCIRYTVRRAISRDNIIATWRCKYETTMV